tara:strand:+ start:1927 stop:2547 length:621 start_codon:yes stop_codon:yes gene_type:complete
MEIISNEIFKIRIKPNIDKKYILNKTPKENIIGVIPFFWNKPNINRYDKKYYLNHNYFLLNKNNQMMKINVRDKKETETSETYKKIIKKQIVKFFEEKYNIKGLKMKNIIDILDILEGKIRIFLININTNKKIHKVFSKDIKNLEQKNICRYLIYFNDPELENTELLNNMYQMEENKYILNKTLSLVDEENILELKLRTIYKKMVF